VENLHFSLPHVQNLFDETPGRYHWVISMSQAVELSRRGLPEQGVLLVDMNFSGIKQLLEKANPDNTSEYIYLCSSRGDIIYHPRMSLINAGLYSEDNLTAAGRTDGTYMDFFEGTNRTTIVKTVSYTGWKLVSVIPHKSYSMGMGKSPYFVVLVLSFALLGILLVNQIVSGNIVSPLLKLDDSVKDLENGNLSPEIYIGGPLEVEHLGRTLKTSVQQINQLMEGVLTEQEQIRRSELDSLQSATTADQGRTYLSAMEDNLYVLTEALS
jgi:two-component system sensor histidine kinase YesM